MRRRTWCANAVAAAAVAALWASPAESAAQPDAKPRILWEQGGFSTGVSIASNNFEAAFDNYDAQGSDDFIVPEGQVWSLAQIAVHGYFAGAGHLRSANVVIYKDSRGDLPGAVLIAYSELAGSYIGVDGFRVTLPEPLQLMPGRYWLSVQSNMDFASDGHWSWGTMSARRGYLAVWKNPGNGFGTGCTIYRTVKSCFRGDLDLHEGPDFDFTLYGNRAKSAHQTLWDQRDGDSFIGLTAQNFEATFDQYDSQAADDFIVPAGETWMVKTVEVIGTHFSGGTGPIRSMHVTLFRNRDERPGRPGEVVRDFLEARVEPIDCVGCGSYLVYLPEPVQLKPGKHWLALQANLDFQPFGEQWGWETSLNRHGRPAVWRNPGNGFATDCIDFQRQLHCFTDIGQGPDHMFALYGKRN